MTERFWRLLDSKGWDLEDDAKGNVAVPGDEELSVYGRVLRGLPDGDVAGRSFSVLEFAVPSLEMHLVAVSQFEQDSHEWSNCFGIVVLNWFAGARGSHQTLIFDGHKFRSRNYKPDVAADERRAGVTYVPWLTLAIHDQDPIPAGDMEFPLFHRPDLRRCTANAKKDVVLVDGEFFVNLDGVRPYGEGATPLAIQLRILQSLFEGDLTKLWGRLNSDPIYDKRTGQRWKPYQWVVAHGIIDGLELTGDLKDGYPCARGRFDELSEEVASCLISESDLERMTAEVLREMEDQRRAEHEHPNESLVETRHRDNARIECEFDISSVRAFLYKAATVQADQESIEPAKPYGRLLRLISALDADAVGLAGKEHFSEHPSKQVPMLRLIPKNLHHLWVMPLKCIAEKHAISIDTIKRRLRKKDLRVIKRFRPPSILLETYEEHKDIFRFQVKPSPS